MTTTRSCILKNGIDGKVSTVQIMLASKLVQHFWTMQAKLIEGKRLDEFVLTSRHTPKIMEINCSKFISKTYFSHHLRFFFVLDVFADFGFCAEPFCMYSDFKTRPFISRIHSIGAQLGTLSIAFCNIHLIML